MNLSKLEADKMIIDAYNCIKYWSLENLKRPYIFGCSAIMNEDIRYKTIDAGFDGCLISPITFESVNDLMTNFVDKYVNQHMSEQVLN